MPNEASEFPPFPITHLPRRWLLIGLLLWILLSAVYAGLIGPWLVENRLAGHPLFLPLGWWAPVALALPSAALALLAAIFTLSPLPTRVLFGPTRARVLGGLGLWLIWPLISIGPLIISAGFGFGADLFAAVATGDFVHGWYGRALTLTVLAFCYGAACLLSHALPRWRIRMAAYTLIWLGGLMACLAAGTLQRAGNM